MFQALRLKLVLLLTLHLTKCDKDLVSYIYLLDIAIFVEGRLEQPTTLTSAAVAEFKIFRILRFLQSFKRFYKRNSGNGVL